ncbi:hypothetical protein N0V83_007867 [Neocucurbitaria cava]|uniref:Uncharacterized protein n=1 Tax=Neocucurbitaria cava TaxID=798079 RepID=A0A9W8Y4D8_9PLEO|nr:hypothetical protein N0V83_007867 [Neocucurbitaria cava]
MEAQEQGKKGPFGKKELKLLYATYSEADLYNSGTFKPLTRNLTTGAKLGLGHHCQQCNGKMTQSCYENLHYAYCATWVNRMLDGKPVRRRCGERFALRSDGCGRHPRVQGYNEPLYRAAEGYDVALSEFDDPDPDNSKGEPEDDEEDWEAEHIELARLTEEEIAKNGFLPADFHNSYWQALRQEQAFAKSKKRRAVETGSEDVGENPTTNGRGQANVVANGKAGAGKKTQNRAITFADQPHEKHGRGASTYAGTVTADKPKRSYAPKGSKPKAPMEVPRRPAAGSNDENANNEGKGKGKTRVGTWWSKKKNGNGGASE